MKVFEYAIIIHPTDEQKKEGKKSHFVKGKQGFLITSILADDIDKAKMLAARDIPDEFINDLDQVELAIRPF